MHLRPCKTAHQGGVRSFPLPNSCDGSRPPLTDSNHESPAFDIVGKSAVVPEYGQRNANKAQAGIVIPTTCASRRLACLLHQAYPEPRYAIY